MTFESRAASMTQDRDRLTPEAHESYEESHDELHAGGVVQAPALRIEVRASDPGSGSSSAHTWRDPSGAKLPRDRRSRWQRIAVAGTTRSSTGADDEGLRFDPSVPVKEIQVPNPEIEGEDLDRLRDRRREGHLPTGPASGFLRGSSLRPQGLQAQGGRGVLLSSGSSGGSGEELCGRELSGRPADRQVCVTIFRSTASTSV